MTRFIVRRLFATAIILVLLSVAVFALLRIMPGDEGGCPPFSPPACYKDLKHERGLDQPYFPVSVDASPGHDWWLLALPAAALAVVAVKMRRRPEA